MIVVEDGILHPKDGPITELSAEAIDETFNTNCKGMLFTVKYAARQMIKQGVAQSSTPAPTSLISAWRT